MEEDTTEIAGGKQRERQQAWQANRQLHTLRPDGQAAKEAMAADAAARQRRQQRLRQMMVRGMHSGEPSPQQQQQQMQMQMQQPVVAGGGGGVVAMLPRVSTWCGDMRQWMAAIHHATRQPRVDVGDDVLDTLADAASAMQKHVVAHNGIICMGDDDVCHWLYGLMDLLELMLRPDCDACIGDQRWTAIAYALCDGDVLSQCLLAGPPDAAGPASAWAPPMAAEQEMLLVRARERRLIYLSVVTQLLSTTGGVYAMASYMAQGLRWWTLACNGTMGALTDADRLYLLQAAASAADQASLLRTTDVLGNMPQLTLLCDIAFRVGMQQVARLGGSDRVPVDQHLLLADSVLLLVRTSLATVASHMAGGPVQRLQAMCPPLASVWCGVVVQQLLHGAVPDTDIVVWVQYTLQLAMADGPSVLDWLCGSGMPIAVHQVMEHVATQGVTCTADGARLLCDIAQLAQIAFNWVLERAFLDGLAQEAAAVATGDSTARPWDRAACAVASLLPSLCTLARLPLSMHGGGNEPTTWQSCSAVVLCQVLDRLTPLVGCAADTILRSAATAPVLLAQLARLLGMAAMQIAHYCVLHPTPQQQHDAWDIYRSSACLHLLKLRDVCTAITRVAPDGQLHLQRLQLMLRHEVFSGDARARLRECVPGDCGTLLAVLQ